MWTKYFFKRKIKPKLHKINVFTKEKQKGNLAGVVTHFEEKDSSLLQQIATKLNLPATVFVFPSKLEDCNARVRFFTPSQEIKVCGHGALATFDILSKQGTLKKITLNGIEGKIVIEKGKDGVVELSFYKKLPPTNIDSTFEEISNLINLKDVSFLDNKFPLAIASVGIPILCIPVKSRDILFSLKPDLEKISIWSKKQNVGGIYIYTSDTIHQDSTFHARCFNPRFNPMGEDIATGAAAGALSIVCRDNNDFYKKIIIEQGTFLNRESKIFVSNNENEEIKIGGHLTLEESINLDEIDYSLVSSINNFVNIWR